MFTLAKFQQIIANYDLTQQYEVLDVLRNRVDDAMMVEIMDCLRNQQFSTIILVFGLK